MKCRICDATLTNNEAIVYDHKLNEYRDTCIKCAGTINRYVNDYDYKEDEPFYVQTPIDEDW